MSRAGEAIKLRPAAYRFFEGGGFPSALRCRSLTAKFKTSFRVWLRYGQLLKSEKITDEERMGLALDLCFESVDEGYPTAALASGMSWFHSGDDLGRVELLTGKGMDAHKKYFEDRLEKETQKGPAFDSFWDAGTLWGSFRAAFEIDLFTADPHWWAFLALSAELPENCGVRRLAALRARNPMDVDAKSRSDLYLDKLLVSLPRGGVLEGAE